MTHEDPSAFSISRSADYRVHVTHPIIDNQRIIGAVVLSRTPQSLSQLLERKKTTIIIYTLFIIIIIWMFSYFTSFAIRKPLDALVEQANKATQGKSGIIKTLTNPVTHEVNELSLAITQMADTLENRAQYLIEFSSHISHELKSPLTSIQGAIELLIDHNATMSKEQQLHFMNNIQQDSQRLECLAMRLLDLAKADLQTEESNECNAFQATEIILNNYYSNSIETNINCKPYQISHQQINNADNHALLSLNFNAYSSILINLIDNAIQADASKIDVSTEIRYESENYQYYVISVSDNGEEISAANQAKIFTPFFTTHRNSGGSGLGLSIIQSLLRNANGDICFSEDNGLKTFTIRIPILNKKN